MEARGSSQYSSRGGSALGAELELFGEDKNDVWNPPPLGSDLPLYIKVGRVHGGLGEFSLWSTCTGVQEGLAATWCGQWCCHGAEEAPGIVQLLCSDTLSVRLCWLGPAFTRCTL
jgi:hypothetical protein